MVRLADTIGNMKQSPRCNINDAPAGGAQSGINAKNAHHRQP
jgi:hypothetical protein